VADARLRGTQALAVAAALLFYSRGQWECWPSLQTVADRLGTGPKTVQRALRRLEDTGWLRRRQEPWGEANATGRKLVLTWLLPDALDPTPPDTDVLGAGHPRPGRAGLECPPIEKEPRSVGEGEESETPRPPSINGTTSESTIPVAGNPGRVLALDLAAHMTAPIRQLDDTPTQDTPGTPTMPLVKTPAALTTGPTTGPGDAPEGPSGPLLKTPGQADFLDQLTDEQRQRFEELPRAKQVEMLAPHALGRDRIIAGEQARILGPQRPRPELPVIGSVPEALDAIATHRDPRAAVALAEMLAQEFDDRHSWDFYYLLARHIAGEPDVVEQVMVAYHQALKDGVRNRGAVFVTALRRAGLVG
jgi:hypothetical protein